MKMVIKLLVFLFLMSLISTWNKGCQRDRALAAQAAAARAVAAEEPASSHVVIKLGEPLKRRVPKGKTLYYTPDKKGDELIARTATIADTIGHNTQTDREGSYVILEAVGHDVPTTLSLEDKRGS